MRKPIYILLATFNGERFLEDQLASIFAQEDGDWLLLVRDDNSTDSTSTILQYAASRDSRISVLENPGADRSIGANFFALMQAASDKGADYFALCDQDDVWLPDKLSHLRAAITQLEAVHGADMPALCWSDLAWIDSGGLTMAASHFRQAGAYRALEGGGLWSLAMNVVPGCAMLGNLALLKLALPRPAEVVHHDWWLLLIASACGQTLGIDRPLVAYRQHAGNAIGASGNISKIMDLLRSPAAILARSRATYWQGVSNAENLRSRLACDQFHAGWISATDHAIEKIGSSSAWVRSGAVVCGPVRRIGWWRQLLMVISAAESSRLAVARR